MPWRSLTAVVAVALLALCASSVEAQENRVLALIEDLGSDDVGTLARAAETLVQIGAPAIPRLRDALSHGDPSIRHAVPGILEAIGAPAVPALCRGLESPDEIVQFDSVRALRRLGPKASEAIPCLGTALRTSLGAEAAWALDEVGVAAVPSLITALQDLSVTVDDGQDKRLATARSNALASIMSRLARRGEAATAAIPTIARLLRHSDSYVRYTAARALGQLGTLARDTVPELERAENDGEPGVKQAASEAIRLIRRGQ